MTKNIEFGMSTTKKSNLVWIQQKKSKFGIIPNLKLGIYLMHAHDYWSHDYSSLNWKQSAVFLWEYALNLNAGSLWEYAFNQNAGSLWEYALNQNAGSLWEYALNQNACSLWKYAF